MLLILNLQQSNTNIEIKKYLNEIKLWICNKKY